MKRRYKSLLRWGVAISILLICVATFVAYKAKSDIEISDLPFLSESPSPANLGQACFLVESTFTQYSAYFYIRDGALSSQPVLVGGPYASDGDVEMRDALWSKDGSVVAVHGIAGQDADPQFNPYSGKFWLNAYDFHQHKPVGAGLTWRQKSTLIQKVMAQRGGTGKTAVSYPNTSERVMSEQEMKEFNWRGR